MSFTPDIFRSKLDALQDTQDSIVSISQWVLFHHRNAAHLCQLWTKYTLDNNSAFSPKKKLSLLYLCNDVVQQARHKRKPEFAAGFAALLPKVIHAIYSSVGSDIQPKIERLIFVWSQRSIFSRDQIAAMKKAITLSKAGKSLDDVSADPTPNLPTVDVEPALAPLNTLFQSISKANKSASSNVSSIKNQVNTYLPEDPSSSETLPSPKVYISKLNMLEKLCNITCTTINDADEAQKKALSILSELTKDLTESIATGKSNYDYIQAQLPRLQTVRDELKEMVGEEPSPSFETEEPSPSFDSTEEPSPTFDSTEEPSPSFDSTEQSSPSFKSTIDPPKAVEIPKFNNVSKATAAENSVPKYESSSDDSDDESVQEVTKKRSLSDDNPRPLKKTVAFSENIQIKEFERDEREVIGEYSNGHSENETDSSEDSFTVHHKDSLQLKHEHEAGSGDDEYDPSSLEDDQSDQKAGLMDLLSKLN